MVISYPSHYNRKTYVMKSSRFLVPGIVMVGLVLRIPFTTIPAVLSDVAQGLHVSVDSLGILTSIPLLMFAVLSNLAPKIAEKTGLERLFAYVLFLMTVGSILRVVNVPFLYIGTMVLGSGIAMLNVLLPSLISVNFPGKIGLYTTVYTTSMCLATAFASGFAPTLVKATSWKMLILVLSALVFLAFLVWLPNSNHNHQLVTKSSSHASHNLWKNKAAMMMLLFGGIQSMLFYTELTWLPTMAQGSGLSKELSGALAGYFSLISIPLSMVIPGFIARASQTTKKWVLLAFCVMSLVGLPMLLVKTDSLVYWLVVNTLLALSVGALFPYLLTAFSLKTSSGEMTARLSGMVQSGGYLLAAIGPAMFGYGYHLTGSWHVVVFILFGLSIIMTLALMAVEQHDKIA